MLNFQICYWIYYTFFFVLCIILFILHTLFSIMWHQNKTFFVTYLLAHLFKSLIQNLKCPTRGGLNKHVWLIFLTHFAGITPEDFKYPIVWYQIVNQKYKNMGIPKYVHFYCSFGTCWCNGDRSKNLRNYKC